MINPNKMYRIRNAEVIKLNGESIECRSKGTTFKGWVKNYAKLAVGDKVNLQVQFSICLDSFVINTANKPKMISRLKKPVSADYFMSALIKVMEE